LPIKKVVVLVGLVLVILVGFGMSVIGECRDTHRVQALP
jgi:hypothetical protein